MDEKKEKEERFIREALAKVKIEEKKRIEKMTE